ncbi:thiol reductant ABC exporter subunit CydC [Gulosibacter sp. 10]|uniref:thiol reductant ABC exporter subunit CydC n=1 Tax=Gulosibacter sp. 10 TaxID=1255570 RepID=UPI00097F2AB4|nr:thiol reductant ABC exporter subunit CydC [Gulosibacter sp. 10]SJM70528.1 Transport ATP-binding protein CydD [Gulosibacter sp. 10]
MTGGARSPAALLGRSGRRALVLLAVLSALKAVALILIAEAVTAGIVAIVDGTAADGTGAWRGAVILGLAGAVLRGALVWATRVVARRTTSASKAELRGELAKRLMSSRDPHVGAMTALGTKSLDELDAYFTTFLPALANALVVPVSIGAWILAADWLSAAIIAVTIPLVPVFMVLIGQHTRDEAARASNALLRLSEHLVELARGLPVLVGLGRVREQDRALSRLSDEHRVRTMRTLRTAFMSSLALELISTVSVAVVAVFIGLRLVYGSMDLGTGLLVLILAAECYAPFREAGAAYHASEDGVNALRRVRAVLERAGQRPLFASADTSDDGMGGAGSGAAAPADREISVRELGVAFPGRAPLFADFSCTIPAGSTVLLDGPSGSGKSTLLDVLAGRLGSGAEDAPRAGRRSAEHDRAEAAASDRSTDPPPPEAPRVSGRVLGVDPGLIAWVPQHPRTFAETLAGELILHVAGAGPTPREAEGLRERAVGVLAELGLGDPERSPATLSPGELRRLAIARALLRVDEGATLLLCDEPTAHLDPVSAQRVRAAIAGRSGSEQRLTTVIASHDPLAQRLCGLRISVPSGAVSDGTAAWAATARSTATVGDGAEAAERDTATEPPDAPRSRAGADWAEPGPAPSRRAADAPPGPGAARAGRASDPADGAASRGAALQELGRFLRPARWRFILAALLGTLAVGFGIAQTALSGWLIVSAAEQPPIMLLTVAIVGVRFFGIGRAALRYAERIALHDAVFRGAGSLRTRLWDEMATSGLRFSGLRRSDQTFGLFIGDVDRIRDEVPRVLLPPVVAAATLAGLGIAAALVLPSALPPLLLLALIGLLLAPLMARFADRRAAEREHAAKSRLGGVFASALSAAPELHVHGVSDSVVARLDALESEAGRSSRRSAWAEGLGQALAVLASVGAACAIIATAAPLGGAAHGDGKLLAVFALATLALAEPLLDAVTAVQRSGSLASALSRVAEVRARLRADPATAASAAPAPAPDVDAEDPAAGLELDDVTARWPGQRRPVIAGLSERVRPGEWLTVTGPSGSGKSTLLAVILGHLPPERGEVRAGGLPVEPDVSGRIAWCPQDAHLFDSTLRANLLLARPASRRPDEAEMRSALERVGLGPLLDGLADGLDTRIGASGGHLSGGQRQRVAVARTLLTGAPVVLLDEPTAHLDETGAAELSEDLRRALRDAAVVCVTHRSGDIRPGDIRRALRAGTDRRAAPESDWTGAQECGRRLSR